MEALNEKNITTDTEAEKLRLEVEELKWKVKWAYKVGQFISVTTAFLAVGAFLVSLYQFNAQQQESAKRDAEAKVREAKAYEQEFRKPVWEKQLALLFEVSNAAATIATSPREAEDRKKAEARFHQLFWGPVVLAEKNQELKNEMIKFSNCLAGISDDCDSEAKRTSRLQQLSLALTNKCLATIGSIWDIRFANLYEKEEEEVKSTQTLLP